MQWLAHTQGGLVVPHQENKEYGKTAVEFDTRDRLFSGAKKRSIVLQVTGIALKEFHAAAK